MNIQGFVLPPMAEQKVLWIELHEAVRSSGLLKRQYPFYTGKILVTLCLLGAGILCLVVVANFWAQMANALAMAFVSTQIMLTGHSSGHGQIFSSWRKNYRVSLAIAFLAGGSPSWWGDKHGGHHKNPNNVDLDGDVNVSVLAFTEKQALEKKGLQRFVVKHQHVFFLPILLLVALSFKSASIHYLLSSSKGKLEARYRWGEMALLAAHAAGYTLLLVFLLDSWLNVLAFTAVHQGFTGLYMGSIFATNHKGMPMFQDESKVGFLLRQVLPSRDLKNLRCLDFLFGGLNFQIEHHLWPYMPENNLRKAQKIVRRFCGEHKIPYCETGVLQTCGEILEHLRRVSAPLRDRPA